MSRGLKAQKVQTRAGERTGFVEAEQPDFTGDGDAGGVEGEDLAETETDGGLDLADGEGYRL